MIRLFLIISFSIFMVSCNRDSRNQPEKPQKKLNDTLQKETPEIENISLLKDKSDSIKIPFHIMQKGETLWDLGKKYYANRHYSSIIKIYNKITDVEGIKVGSLIKVPSLKIIFTEEKLGLSPIIKKELELILEARKLYLSVEKNLWDIRRKSKWKGQQNLPQDVTQKLLLASDNIDIAVSSIVNLKGDVVETPTKMISRLKHVSKNLKKLAAGSNDGYGYDLDMIHQNLIRAFLRGIEWAENDYH